MGSSRKSDTVHLAHHHSTLRIKARVEQTNIAYMENDFENIVIHCHICGIPFGMRIEKDISKDALYKARIYLGKTVKDCKHGKD